VVAFAALEVVAFPFGSAQSTFAIVGGGVLRGEVPYVDLWHKSPPGVFLVYALAQASFGNTMLAPRLLEALLVLLSSALVVGVGRRLFLDSRAGLIAAAIAAAIHTQLGHAETGHAESFGGVVTIVGLACALRETEPSYRKQAWAMACGLAFGVAALLTPALGAGALPCAVALARREHLLGHSPLHAARSVLVVSLGVALPIIGCATWLWAAGAWPALTWTLFEFAPDTQTLGSDLSPASALYFAATQLFFGLSAIAGVGVLAAAISPPISSRERQNLSLLLAIIAIHAAGIALEAEFVPHQFAATIPLLALVAGLGWVKLWRPAQRQGAGGVVAIASLLFVVAGAGSPSTATQDVTWAQRLERLKSVVSQAGPAPAADVPQRVAQRVAELSAPDETVFVWGLESSIYWLSARKPATRFVHNLAQRTPGQSSAPRASLLRDLHRTRPALIVVEHGDTPHLARGPRVDSHQALESFPELASIIEVAYERVERLERFDIYRRAIH
jgi:4-amino-4-deoxy-L-arabinose transferase-like glycosyltransferase